MKKIFSKKNNLRSILGLFSHIRITGYSRFHQRLIRYGTVLAVLVFSITVLSLVLRFYRNIRPLSAGTESNTIGWAWNDTIEWISFNSLNCDINGDNESDGLAGCPPRGDSVSTYGVGINGRGRFRGYAWSEMVGWISFEYWGDDPPDNYSFNSNCDNNASCDDTHNCTACYNSSDKNVYGWARICSLTDDPGNCWDKGSGRGEGWISFSCTNTGVCGASNYQVYLDDQEDFHGYAWSDSFNWISFNCKEGGIGATDICAASDYRVSKRIVDPGLKLLLKMEENNPFVDSGPFAHSIDPVTGASIDNTEIRAGNYSGYFDGVNDYLTVDDADQDDDFWMDNGPFTIDFWFKLSYLHDISGEHGFFEHREDNNNNVFLVYDHGSGDWQFRLRYNGTNLVNLQTNYPLALDHWYHIAVERGWQGASDRWSIIVDNTEIAWADLPLVDWPWFDSPDFRVGEVWNNKGTVGWIDNFRITKGRALDFDWSVQNVYGWAWSNYGWISFNSIDCDADNDGLSDALPPDCPPVDTYIENYGVNIDPVNYNFSGYAWNTHLGWINFNLDPPEPWVNFNGNCQVPSACDDAGDNCSACIKVSDIDTVYGWARACVWSQDQSTCTGGNNGWIKFKNQAGDNAPLPDVNYGVDIPYTGRFEGWAWGGDDTVGGDGVADIGLGWISFSCTDYGTCVGGSAPSSSCSVLGAGLCPGSGDCVSTCGFSNHQVYTTLFVSPPEIRVYPLPGDACRHIRVAWDVYDGSRQEGFRVYGTGTNPFIPDYIVDDPDCDNGNDNCRASTTPAEQWFIDYGEPPPLAPSTTMCYIVSAYKGEYEATSSPIKCATTYAVCEVDPPTKISGDLTAVCPDQVYLRWDEPDAACKIKDYEIERCSCNSRSDCSNCDITANYSDITAGDCAPMVGTSTLGLDGIPHCDPARDPPAECLCVDNDFPADNVHFYYRYRLRAHCDDGYNDCDQPDASCGEWSEFSDIIQPCPRLPFWQEVK